MKWHSQAVPDSVRAMRKYARAVLRRAGRKIKRLRELRGLSQEKLAELVGNTPRHIGQVERAEVNVTIDILAGVAEHLSVDIAELFRVSPSEGKGERIYVLGQRDVEQLEDGWRVVQRVKRTGL